MVVVNETKRGQLLALLEQCAHLNADVRPRTDKGYFTVTVPPPWNGPAQRKAQEETARKRHEALDKLPETLEALQAAQADADALNVDQAYRLTLLELGITE